MAFSNSAGFSDHDQAVLLSGWAGTVSRRVTAVRRAVARFTQRSNDQLSGPSLSALTPGLNTELARRINRFG